MLNGEESKEDLKNLLGYMGIEILFAIDKGAKNFETIKLFSGLPISCIKGRIPVLVNLIKGSKKNEAPCSPVLRDFRFTPTSYRYSGEGE